MEYSIHGPFVIERIKNKKKKKTIVDDSNEAKKRFWGGISKNNDTGLRSACGCYLFAVKAGKGFKPWYVGLTKHSFEECFYPHKIGIYNKALVKCGRGTPVLFLISRLTKETGNFVKASKNGHRDINFLENMLIAAAIAKNPDLMNIQNTKYLKKMCVPGLINTPKRKPFHSEQCFKKAIKK
jgi:hypothetical protein